MPVILDNKPLNDITRTVECAACGKPFVVRAALESNGQCLSCKSAVCAFCGCTSDHPCVNDNFPDGQTLQCTFVEFATCEFCRWVLAENNYFVATDRKDKIQPFRPRRRALARV